MDNKDLSQNLNGSQSQLDFKSVKQYLPYILIVGIGIGTTNYIIHADFNWLQWIILSVSTSFIIGSALLWAAANKSIIRNYLNPNWKLYITLAFCFFFIGLIATEIESLIKNLIFLSNIYTPFSAGSLYLSNGSISIFLGFSFFLNDRLFPFQIESIENTPKEILNQDKDSPVDRITKIPIKQGERILLIQLEDIVYFEAYDNYSHLYHANGKKMLCDYSLAFLEKRLSSNFLRVHRKHIVNTTHIKQIIPHLNGRFLIQFENNLDAITSSKGYLKTMRKLVKIE